MRRLLYALIPALLLTLTACDPKNTGLIPDSITINVTGLPKELQPDITITGPNGYEQTITETTTLEELAAGQYTVTVNAVEFRGNGFDPDQATHQLALVAGDTQSARITYAPHRAFSQAVLEHFNEYRAGAGLPTGTLDANGSLPNWLHARYLVENYKTGHNEDPDLPWYTPEGEEAGLKSNVSTRGWIDREPIAVMHGLAQAPFHLMNLLDPRTTGIRLGHYENVFENSWGDFTHESAATVLQPLMNGAWPAGRKVYFPGDGQTVEILAHWGETPSPPHMCPTEYHAGPNGLPIFVTRGWGNPPTVLSSSIRANGAPIEHCVVLSTTEYGGRESHAETIGRALEAYGATVLLPLHPLEPLTTYAVSLTTNDGVEEWTFSTADVEMTLYSLNP